MCVDTDTTKGTSYLSTGGTGIPGTGTVSKELVIISDEDSHDDEEKSNHMPLRVGTPKANPGGRKKNMFEEIQFVGEEKDHNSEKDEVEEILSFRSAREESTVVMI